MATLRWGILGCGDVAEYKGGPPLYTVDDSELIAVMRRDRTKAEDFAKRHGAKRAYTDIDASSGRRRTQRNLHCNPAIPPLRTHAPCGRSR